jgi:general secretion pathway protein G
LEICDIFMQRNRDGFTLIELIIVIGIIAILATIMVAGVGISRSKARDARRASDVAQLRKAFTLHANTTGAYPLSIEGTCIDGSDAVTAALIDTQSMQNVPQDPVAPSQPPPRDQSHCYSYTSRDGSTYEMSFYLENDSTYGEPGTQTVGP